MIPDEAERCPTCGSVVEVVTADEGTSSYRPSRPHLVTDETVERAADAIAAEFGYVLSDDEEMYDAAYWQTLARHVLEAALEKPS